jgi:hypothetical protein
VQIEQLMHAEPGWRAVFKEPDGGESLSRIVGWGTVRSGDDAEPELVGFIVDPAQPSKIVAAPGTASPDGGSFARYRFVPPEPIVLAPPPPPPQAEEEPEDTTQQIAKSLLKRRR